MPWYVLYWLGFSSSFSLLQPGALASGVEKLSPSPGPQEITHVGADVHDFRHGCSWPTCFWKTLYQKVWCVILVLILYKMSHHGAFHLFKFITRMLLKDFVPNRLVWYSSPFSLQDVPPRSLSFIQISMYVRLCLSRCWGGRCNSVWACLDSFFAIWPILSFFGWQASAYMDLPLTYSCSTGWLYGRDTQEWLLAIYLHKSYGGGEGKSSLTVFGMTRETSDTVDAVLTGSREKFRNSVDTTSTQAVTVQKPSRLNVSCLGLLSCMSTSPGSEHISLWPRRNEETSDIRCREVRTPPWCDWASMDLSGSGDWPVHPQASSGTLTKMMFKQRSVSAARGTRSFDEQHLGKFASGSHLLGGGGQAFFTNPTNRSGFLAWGQARLSFIGTSLTLCSHCFCLAAGKWSYISIWQPFSRGTARGQIFAEIWGVQLLQVSDAGRQRIHMEDQDNEAFADLAVSLPIYKVDRWLLIRG